MKARYGYFGIHIKANNNFGNEEYVALYFPELV